jgi:hypothetical protein
VLTWDNLSRRCKLMHSVCYRHLCSSQRQHQLHSMSSWPEHTLYWCCRLYQLPSWQLCYQCGLYILPHLWWRNMVPGWSQHLHPLRRLQHAAGVQGEANDWYHMYSNQWLQLPGSGRWYRLRCSKPLPFWRLPG